MNTFTRLARIVTVTALIALSVTLSSKSVQAQTPAPPLPGQVIATNLDAPRGIVFDSAGNLLVAIAGKGGDTPLTAPSTETAGETMVIKSGLSGKILSIGKDGKSTTLMDGLPSYAAPTETFGVYRIIPRGTSLWMVMNSSTPTSYWSSAVIEYDAKTLEMKRIINIRPFEVANNPDGNEVDSNAADIAWQADGTMLIVDAGGNSLLSWTEKNGLALVTAWKDNPVPDSIEVAANGDIYIGFLGTALAPGAGRIERWSEGKLAESFKGLNAVTDIALDGTDVYAVELLVITEKGPGPGRVMKVNAKNSTVIAEGLVTPFGITKGPEGAWYVSMGTIALAPGVTGSILKLNK
jgi:hypothetical protein